MSDIFEEVEEGLRQDRASELWQRFAPFVWGALLIAVGVVAVRELVLIPQAEEAREARAQAFETALQAYQGGEYNEAGEAFDALASAGEPISGLAAHYLAAVRLEGNGDREAALNALESAAAADGDPYEQLALLKAAYAKADEETLEGVEIMLAGLSEEETAFGALARELIAMKAFAAGDMDRARDLFGYLKFDASAPAGVQQRADIALASIPPSTASETPVEEAPTDETPETEAAATPAEEAPEDATETPSETEE